MEAIPKGNVKSSEMLRLFLHKWFPNLSPSAELTQVAVIQMVTTESRTAQTLTTCLCRPGDLCVCLFPTVLHTVLNPEAVTKTETSRFVFKSHICCKLYLKQMICITRLN